MQEAKQLELPPAVAKAFVKDMKVFFKEKDLVKRDEIAARQLWVLQQHQGPRGALLVSRDDQNHRLCELTSNR